MRLKKTVDALSDTGRTAGRASEFVQDAASSLKKAADAADTTADIADKILDEGIEGGSTSKIANKFPDEAMPQDGKIIDYVKMLGGKE